MTQSDGSLSQWPRSAVQGLISPATHSLGGPTQLTGVSFNCYGADTVLVMSEDVSRVLKLVHLPHIVLKPSSFISGNRPMSAQ